MSLQWLVYPANVTSVAGIASDVTAVANNITGTE